VAAAADIIQYAFLVKSLLKAGVSLAAISMIVKKDPEDLAKLAANVVKDFKNLECKECAEALLKEFNKAGVNGTIRELRRPTDFIIDAAGDGSRAVSENGRHFGVQVGNTVYDLLHPNGIPIDSWAKAYQSYGNIVLVPK
jgi:DNA-binding transcriptional MerR regulator